MMTSIQRFLGSTPRIRTLEALLRLGDLEFTRPELADETDLHKPSVYRIVDELEEDGVIHQVRTKRPATYRTNPESGRLRLLAAFTAALRILDRHPERETQVVDGFRKLALRGTVSAEHQGLVRLVDPSSGSTRDASADTQTRSVVSLGQA